MTQRARLAIIGLAVAALVVAFIAASGSGGSDSGDATGPATQAAPAAPAGTGAAATATAATPAPAAAAVPVVRVVGGKPQGGIQDLTFDKGDTVRFTVRSDVADEIHVHGYDVGREVPAGGSVTFSFPARIDGRFVVELEGHGEQIAQLEVRP